LKLIERARTRGQQENTGKRPEKTLRLKRAFQRMAGEVAPQDTDQDEGYDSRLRELEVGLEGGFRALHFQRWGRGAFHA
jgi:hypothetical protein